MPALTDLCGLAERSATYGHYAGAKSADAGVDCAWLRSSIARQTVPMAGSVDFRQSFASPVSNERRHVKGASLWGRYESRTKGNLTSTRYKVTFLSAFRRTRKPLSVSRLSTSPRSKNS